MSTITVVRLPNPRDAANPLERVITTVARADLDLADALHDGDGIRPYATVRRRDTLDVVAFTDELTRALLVGEPAARLVTRARLSDLGTPPDDRLVVAFETPTHFRVGGFEHTLPDAASVVGSLRQRWDALGYPPLPDARLGRVPVMPRRLMFRRMPAGHGVARGFLGTVGYDLRPLDPDEREVVRTLLAFGEYRGVGKHTAYGMGRLRILAPDEPWEPDRRLAAWDAA